MAHDNLSKFNALREMYPYFTYEAFDYNVEGGEIHISFHFNLADKIEFRPSASLALRDEWLKTPEQPGTKDAVENLVFHIGMIELISYWKTACPPEVIIKPLKLTASQAEWWKTLYYKGMGEFMYLNGIPAAVEDLMQIIPMGVQHADPFEFSSTGGKLVPVGGGKDSSLTLDLLARRKEDVLPFIINPGKASLDTIETSGIEVKHSLFVKRNLDPVMLEMNQQGFLNGHTPFSALVAFYSLLGAYLSGRADIVLSNESSANEPTIPGTNINHQYSKSFDFEKSFRDYSKKHLSAGFNYYSLLRPMTELQIASLFSGLKQYHKVFRSCNVGSKKNIWCGECPKCLFTWIILSPFLEDQELNQIFDKDLSINDNLSPLLDQLTGITGKKPFECVGTMEEVNLALQKKINSKTDGALPALLKHYKDQGAIPGSIDEIFRQAIKLIKDKENNFLSEKELRFLEDTLKHAGEAY